MPEEIPQELPVSIDKIEVPSLRKGYKIEKHLPKESLLDRYASMERSDEEIDSCDEEEAQLEKLRELISRRRSALFEKSAGHSFLEQLKEHRLQARSNAGEPFIIDIPMFRRLNKKHTLTTLQDSEDEASFGPMGGFVLRQRMLAQDDDQDDDDDLDDSDDMGDDDEDMGIFSL